MMLEEKIIQLMVVAAVVGLAARWWRLPYTVALVAAGLGLSALHVEAGLHLNKELVFAIFLPALLFEAAFHLDIDFFRKNAGPILVLAMVGVALSTFIAGVLTFAGLNQLGADISFLVALLFAALISATDPISVIAIFKKLGLPPRLNLVVEGESLFNDGMAVVVFSLILVAVTGVDAHGAEVGHFNFGWVAMQFGKEVFGGLAVGLIVGLAFSFLTAQVDDHLLEIMLTTIVAYGSYLVSDHLHFSGVIAVVAAGMMSGNYGSKVGMSPTTKIAVISFWEYAAFVVNSLIFLLIGMEVNIGSLWEFKWHIVIAWLAVLLARGIAINSLFPLINRVFNPLPWKWSPVMVWGGLRGSLSMALALSLLSIDPERLAMSELGRNFALHRPMIVAMTFGVVILSILGQGLSMKPLLSLLGMIGGKRRIEYEELQARIRAAHMALSELAEMRAERAVSAHVYGRLKEEYEARIGECEESVALLRESDDGLHREEEKDARRHLLALEKEGIKEAFSMGLIDEEVKKKLLFEADERVAAVSGHGGAGDHGGPDGHGGKAAEEDEERASDDAGGEDR